MEILQRHIAIDTQSPAESDDDTELAARAQLGDQAAFALLYRRYVDRVYAYAAWRLPTHEAAEEATQQVFFRALRGLPGYRHEAPFAPWLFAIARNVVVDTHRAQRRVTAPLDAARDIADPAQAPDEQAEQALQRGELLAARASCLSDRERELFDLLLTGLTQAEIAQVLGRRHGAIRTAHWRLVTRLRACLAGQRAAKEVADGGR